MADSTCHPGKRMWAKGKCRSCYAKHLYKSNSLFRAKIKDNSSRWRLNNPIKDKINGQIKQLRKYGLTALDYNRLLENQKGLCAICHTPERLNRQLAVDHNHITNKVRGLLCFKCNTALGAFDYNLSTLLRVQEYLNVK